VEAKLSKQTKKIPQLPHCTHVRVPKADLFFLFMWKQLSIFNRKTSKRDVLKKPGVNLAIKKSNSVGCTEFSRKQTTYIVHVFRPSDQSQRVSVEWLRNDHCRSVEQQAELVTDRLIHNSRAKRIKWPRCEV